MEILPQPYKIVCYFEDRGDIVMMLCAIKTIFLFNEATNIHANEFTLQTYSRYRQQSVVKLPNNICVLSDANLILPSEERHLLDLAQKLHIRTNNNFMEEWKQFVAERSKQEPPADASSSTAARTLMALTSSTTVSTS